MFGAALKNQQSGMQIAIERWGMIAEEAQALGAEHFAEVEQGVDRRRKFKIDTKLMAGMDALGMLLILSARINGAMVGYYTWQITPDVESEGLLIAQQGAWFVRPGYNRYRIGISLLKRSIEELKARGVQCIFPHHRLAGRGVRLGMLFRRLGAVETQHTYMLWIGK